MPASNRRIYRFSEWALDPAEHLLTRNGSPVPLTPKVFETLLLLIENAGRLVTKPEFMKRVWPDAFVEDLALAQNISLVRKVLNGSSAMIETVPKRGYRFTADVRVVEELPAADFESSDLIADPVAEGARLRNPSASSGQALLVPTPATLSAEVQIAHPRASVRNDTVEIASAGVRNDMPLEDVQIPAAITPAKKMAWATAALFVIAASLVALIWTRTHHEVSAEISPAPVIVPLLDISGEQRMPALSADGSRIAFLRHALEPGKSGIYAEVVGNQSLLQLSTGGSDSHPVWSPDGRYVAFLRESGEAGMDGRPYTFSIIVVPSLGGAERQLYTGNQVPLEGPVSISFSSDSRQIAFAEWDAAAQQSSIKVISLADSTVHTVTSPPSAYHDVAPAFSPDGTEIAFVRCTGPIFVDDIFVVPAPGGEPRQVTFDHRRVFSAPAWTKNGQEIIFSSTRAGMKSLWRIPSHGGSPRPVAGSGPQADHPTFSPANGEIAYEYTIEEENLWRVELPGTGGRPMPHALLSSKTSNLMPQFSPDGQKIAFESDRSGYEEIWICYADGSNARQLTKLERYSGSPRWSPDGRYIAFDFRSRTHSEIYVVEVATRNTHRVASFMDADSVVPSWSRDGQWIYFASNRGGKEFHVWKIQAGGGTAVQLTRAAGFSALESADGRSVVYTRLSEPGFWTVPRDGGAERVVWKGPAPDNWANWAMVNDGIYFVKSKQDGDSEIDFLDADTAQSKHIAKLERPAFYGLTVAPNGSAIVYSQRDRNQHDIVVMMNFR